MNIQPFPGQLIQPESGVGGSTHCCGTHLYLDVSQLWKLYIQLYSAIVFYWSFSHFSGQVIRWYMLAECIFVPSWRNQGIEKDSLFYLWDILRTVVRGSMPHVELYYPKHIFVIKYG